MTEYVLRYYVVLFVDLLGQEDALNYLEQLPIEAEAEHRVGLRKTVGLVNGFFGAVQEMVRDIVPDTIDYLPNDIYCQNYSDSVLFYFPLDLTNSEIPFERVLDAICDFLFICLSTHTPIRGALEIGKGLLIEPQEGMRQIYGPILAKCSKLEKAAGLPSIVVGPSLAAHLPSSVHSKYLSFSSGMHRINFLSDSVARNTEFDRMKSKLCYFIQSQIEEFDRPGSEKVFGRYVALREYVQSRGYWVLNT